MEIRDLTNLYRSIKMKIVKNLTVKELTHGGEL